MFAVCAWVRTWRILSCLELQRWIRRKTRRMPCAIRDPSDLRWGCELSSFRLRLVLVFLVRSPTLLTRVDPQSMRRRQIISMRRHYKDYSLFCYHNLLTSDNAFCWPKRIWNIPERSAGLCRCCKGWAGAVCKQKHLINVFKHHASQHPVFWLVLFSANQSHARLSLL